MGVTFAFSILREALIVYRCETLSSVINSTDIDGHLWLFLKHCLFPSAVQLCRDRIGASGKILLARRRGFQELGAIWKLDYQHPGPD